MGAEAVSIYHEISIIFVNRRCLRFALFAEKFREGFALQLMYSRHRKPRGIRRYYYLRHLSHENPVELRSSMIEILDPNLEAAPILLW